MIQLDKEEIEALADVLNQAHQTIEAKDKEIQSLTEQLEAKDDEMNGLIEIHHEQCKELELIITALQSKL